MPSRAVTSFLLSIAICGLDESVICVNALSGCYLISTVNKSEEDFYKSGVNALSGCYLISTWYQQRTRKDPFAKSVNALSGCYLISTLVKDGIRFFIMCVNALSGCYLISTVPLQKPRFYAVSRDCFCRYLSEYSDSNSFSCMLTIWTYLMR